MVDFDPNHADALLRQSAALIYEARVTDAPVPREHLPSPNPIHPSFTVTKELGLNLSNFFEGQVDGYGEETGRFWIENGKRIGWDGESYQKIKKMASGLASKKPLAGLLSFEFIFSEVFVWLRASLQRRTVSTLPDHLKLL